MGAVKTLLERCCWQTEGVCECELEGEVRERLVKRGREERWRRKEGGARQGREKNRGK